jgi:gas vesicle protein
MIGGVGAVIGGVVGAVAGLFSATETNRQNAGFIANLMRQRDEL